MFDLCLFDTVAWLFKFGVLIPYDVKLQYSLLSGELSLQVLVAPSLVAPGKGLFLCIYDDVDDDSEEIGAVEEIIIPQGKYLVFV